MAEFLPGISEWMLQNSVYHLPPQFHLNCQLCINIFKSSKRSKHVWKIQILILVVCTDHIMIGIFFIPWENKILQKLRMSVNNLQTESTSIEASLWCLYAGITPELLSEWSISDWLPNVLWYLYIHIKIMLISWIK